MKGLLKYLSPFAPDQSGAVSVFYELGGITVICDAGGCTGNICGFDEPRWFLKKSALFSAGLRDMDAILGRDDRLIEKLKDAAARLDGKFAALIGTPVPAVIATDFRALKRMAEKRCGLPVMTVECTGTRMYDKGEEDAYMELFRTFADKEMRREEDSRIAGVIGATPLDTGHVRAGEIIRNRLKARGYNQVYCYGMGAGLDEVKLAGKAEKNFVVSPAGVRAAKYLEREFGTPWEVTYPMLREEWKAELKGLSGRKILIVHQQAAADEIRRTIRQQEQREAEACGKTEIVCGTWFMQLPELKEPQDIVFEKEDQFAAYVEREQFDVIIGDRMLKRALGKYQGRFIHIPHFAVSGEYEEEIY